MSGSQATKTALKFNPFDPAFHVDPYPTYRHLREQDPVHWSFLDVWVLTRYAEVRSVLRDSRFLAVQIPKGVEKRSRYLEKQGKSLDALFEATRHSLFFLNPPDHQRLRGFVSKVFNASMTEKLRAQISAIANELIDSLQHQDRLDIISDFAEQLPIRVMSRMMGFPDSDCDQLHRWSTELFRVFDPMRSLRVAEAMNQVAADFLAYLREQLAHRRQHPQADFLSDLVAVEEQGENLSESEILATCIMLFMAGEQTTTSSIGNGLLALFQHPEQLAWIKQHPEAMQKAVEELFRYDSPTQLVARVAAEPIELAGKTIEPGHNLILCLGAANRDPDVFAEPDQLQLSRPDNRHLAFAAGSHVCLGAGLARLEVPIALQILLQRLPNLERVVEPPKWRENIVIRSLQSLPATFTSTANEI